MKLKNKLTFLLILVIMSQILLLFCSKKGENFVEIIRENFQTVIDGKTTDLYTLKNSNGIIIKITNYGGKIVQILVPGRDGNLGDIVLGYETIDGFINGSPSMGALIGRYANRIANGKFELNGKTYTLATNNGPNHLHGGNKGFRFKVWDAKQIDDQTLQLSYLSIDGEEGYPGNLIVKVTYTLTNEDELKIDYYAVTDKSTVLNLTNHAFFNLAGQGNSLVLDHEVLINADFFTPTDKTNIPTGKITPVKGTPFDFTQTTKIGARINNDDEQLKFGNGYDHNYVVNKSDDPLTFAARVYEPTTGRVMKVFTTEPGIQLYTGNSLSDKDIGKAGKKYPARSAFCLETQHYPDSPNQTNFPTTVLNPGEEFKSITVYKFSVN
ncbi:galactose mutarotase [candidate division KSB1 bacterium]|nr:galactose mutarotase [candidate division KSB1 bacterium]MBL7094805.1 galactose mutarotase [candidate division KSB1 bacterium]